MQAWRRAHHLTRWVLVWFALSLGVAIAAPMVNPQVTDLVCATNGSMKLVVVAGDATDTPASTHTLDCPLCMGAFGLALPPTATQPLPDGARLSWPVASVTPGARATAPPPPSRGPPSLFL